MGSSLHWLLLRRPSRLLSDVFLACVPIIAVALVVAVFLKEVPLRTGQGRRLGAADDVAASARS